MLTKLRRSEKKLELWLDENGDQSGYFDGANNKGAITIRPNASFHNSIIYRGQAFRENVTQKISSRNILCFSSKILSNLKKFHMKELKCFQFILLIYMLMPLKQVSRISVLLTYTKTKEALGANLLRDLS